MGLLWNAFVILSFSGSVLGLLPHEIPVERARYKRYALSRNHEALLKDTVIPYHYNIELRPDIYKDHFSEFRTTGNVTIFIECRRATSRITLHSDDLVINESSISVYQLGGHRIPTNNIRVSKVTYDSKEHFLTLRLSHRLRRKQRYSLTIQYSAALTDNLNGLYASSYRRENVTHYMVVTHFQPHYARKAFPCFDEPKLKASFNITVIRKASHVAISNMPMKRSDLREDGWIEDVFDQTPVMPTYLVAVAVTDYRFKETMSKTGVKIRVWNRADKLDLVDHSLDVAAKAIDFFYNYTGIAYTLPKLDHIAVPDFAFGGMENWGLVMYSFSSLLYDSTDHDIWAKNRISRVVVHEVAHQWFGNMVTAKWWNEIWINEAMTSYMVVKGLQAIIPDYDIDTLIITHRSKAFLADSYHTAHPIDITVTYQEELEKVFDKIAYNKGCLIIRMLVKVIGEKAFQDGVKLFLNRHMFGNADQYDLYDAFNEVLHHTEDKSLDALDVGEFLSTWVQQAGYPVVTIKGGPNGLTINQSRHFIDPENTVPVEFTSRFGGVWRLPVFLSTNASGKDLSSPLAWIPRKQVTLTGEMGFNVTNNCTWIIGNHGLNGYYIVNYDLNNWNLLVHQLNDNHEAIPAINRAELIDEASKLVRSGHLKPHHPFHLLRYIRKEKDYHPWSVFFDNIDILGEKLRFTSSYGVLRKYMLELLGEIYHRMSWRHDETVSSSERFLQRQVIGKACEYDYQPCLDKAVEVFKERDVQPLSAETRIAVFCSVAKSSSVDLWDELYEMYLTVSDEMDLYEYAMDLAAGLSCSKDTWILQRFLRREIERKSDLFLAFYNVAQNPSGGHIALKMVLDDWDYMQHQYVIDTVCENLATEEDYNLIQEFLNNNPDVEEGPYGYAIKAGVEYIEANMAWMEGDGKHIKEWLETVFE